MRYKSALVMAMVLVFGLATHSQAAPAGFKEHKLDGMNVAIPSSWTVAPKEALAAMEKKAPGVNVLIAAEGSTDGFPKFSIMRRQQDTLSQEDFVGMDENGITQMCDQFKTQIAGGAGATDFICKRVKAEKGSALMTQFTVPQAQAVSVSYMFFQGPKQLTVLTGAVMQKDSAKLLKELEDVMKTVRLN